MRNIVVLSRKRKTFCPQRWVRKKAEKKNEAEVQIHLPETITEMAFKKLRIFGQCKVDGRIKYVPVDLSEHVKRDFEDYLTLPSDITNTIAVVVTPYNEEKKCRVNNCFSKG